LTYGSAEVIVILSAVLFLGAAFVLALFFGFGVLFFAWNLAFLGLIFEIYYHLSTGLNIDLATVR